MRYRPRLIVGRKAEQEILSKAIQSSDAEMVAVIGRRRVGKTFLVKSYYSGQIAFEVTGLQNAPRNEQIRNFTNELNRAMGSPVPILPPNNWLDAFYLLIEYLETLSADEKPVVFFDELPWLATSRSGFLRALSNFWNSWAAQRQIVVVVCGSAASWMIKQVVHNKGGLYNRITRRVFLDPFTLAEVKAYLQSRDVRLDHYQILQLYMVMGGIPHYLKEVEPGESAVQAIDRICFTKSGLLSNEFSSLYFALFDDAERHTQVIRALAEKPYGMTRKEILKKAKISDGGGGTKVLDELVSSNFISSFYDFSQKKKNIKYRLTDEYSLFYLKFMEIQGRPKVNSWKQISQSQSWRSWSGYAYESICLKHTKQIIEAMKISGMISEAYVYTSQNTDEIPGFQIDLLIDRQDHIITLFEIKFYKDNWLMSKVDSEDIRRKATLFKAAIKTNKQIQIGVITTFPIIENQYSKGLLDHKFDMDVLFLKK
ncbi:MAG: ATP-binding protein [Bacteroidota bacterium]